jgi:hypothetical protein
MAVGVGHRSLEAATSEEDFATVLKEADGAFLANQNFHDVEARMTRTPDLADPSARGPSQSPLFPPIHRPIPFPALVAGPGLDFDEDEHLALEDDEVEFVAAVTPVDGETATTPAAIMLFGLALAPSAEIDGHGTAAPPFPDDGPQFRQKHGREDLKGDVSAILRGRGS